MTLVTAQHKILPVIALVGRPNVGKSTLFNVLTKSRAALVADQPGLTRDRQYGQCHFFGRDFLLVDTGGVAAGEGKDPLSQLMEKQSWQAVAEAQVILFLVDARAGVTLQDIELAKKLRKTNKPVIFVINKVDGIKQIDGVIAEFHRFGFKQVATVSASHGQGVAALQELITEIIPEETNEDELTELTENGGIKLAIVGRPNVGKSTLVNRILGEERVVVFDMPGTTRDSVFIPFERHGKHYTVIDTAGVRRNFQ